MYIVGGVDFSKQPKRNISRVRFNVENRTLDTHHPDVHEVGRHLLPGHRHPLPRGVTPPATASGPGGTHRPDPHADVPRSRPTRGRPRRPRPVGQPLRRRRHADTDRDPKDPDGDLAHTGSDTPIGLITGIAAAVIAAGAGLVWWMRRRRSGTE